MSRPLVVGNGSLLVTLDSELSIRDIYWPYVGLHNHLVGKRGRIGVWVDSRFSWVNGSDWRRTLAYEPSTLVTCATAEDPYLGITLTLNDSVHHRQDILLLRITVQNHAI